MKHERSIFERVAGSKTARAGLVFVLLLTITVGMVWVGGDTVADRVATLGEEVTTEATDASRVGRRDIWAATWRTLTAHPLLGIGFGGYRVAVSGQHEGSGSRVPQQAHNDYLEVLASGGVVGAAFVFGFLLLVVRQSVPRLRAGSSFARAAALGALTGLCGVAVHSFFEFGLHIPSNAFAALALVAVAAAEEPLKWPKN